MALVSTIAVAALGTTVARGDGGSALSRECVPKVANAMGEGVIRQDAKALLKRF